MSYVRWVLCEKNDQSDTGSGSHKPTTRPQSSLSRCQRCQGCRDSTQPPRGVPREREVFLLSVFVVNQRGIQICIYSIDDNQNFLVDMLTERSVSTTQSYFRGCILLRFLVMHTWTVYMGRYFVLLVITNFKANRRSTSTNSIQAEGVWSHCTDGSYECSRFFEIMTQSQTTSIRCFTSLRK